MASPAPVSRAAAAASEEKPAGLVSPEELKMFPKVLRQIYDASRLQGARIRSGARDEGPSEPFK
jgi:hypothetical protein